MTPVTPGDRIHELRTRAAVLRREADRLDAQAITIAATEYARAERELRSEVQDMKAKLAAATTELARGKALLAPTVPEVSQTQKAPNGASATTETTSL